MAQVARNAFKGYVYQSYVTTLFVAKMDADREIKQIEAETIVDHNFDDLNIQTDKNYYLQIKDYPGTTLDDITISGKEVTIKNANCKFKDDNINILIVNTDLIKTDDKIFDLPCTKKDDIYIVPLTTDTICEYLDNMFCDEHRELQIIHFSLKRISDERFKTSIDDLPEIVRIKHDLNRKTIILRQPLDPWEKGITCIIGKPGVGKSHYVKELTEMYSDAIVYRFWTDSQDERLKDRLQFSSFINDVALSVFGSSKKFTEDELIERIIASQVKLIIDGLDHIENYNPHELEKYFIFINRLSEAFVIVLTRPLKHPIEWNSRKLDNWTYDQTSVYIKQEYPDFSYSINERIYEIAKGYPIITYYLCEHYQSHREIPFVCEISEIEQYYNDLIKDVDVKSCLSLFSINDSFFTRKEITDLLNNAFLDSVFSDFIRNYPYLFNVIRNRISLIHDSLNTYIRLHLQDDIAGSIDEIKAQIQQSIMNTEVEYLARLSSFHFDDSFYCEVARKYVQKETYLSLIYSSVDYESIAELYKQMRLIIDKNRDFYDIYQYYSFSLIHQTVVRNDLIGNEEILFQVISYEIDRKVELENTIFSSGVLWNLYLSIINENNVYYEDYMASSIYGASQIDDTFGKIEFEKNFFDRKGESIENCIKTLQSKSSNFIYASDLISDDLARGWIDKLEPFYSIMNHYLSSEDIETASIKIYYLFEGAIYDEREAKRIIRMAFYRMKELGVLSESDEYRDYSLHDFIFKYSNETSFELSTYVLSFIRLANYEGREIDITSINLFFNMHYAHKDYSIANIDKALLVFEEKGCIDEDDSVDILSKTIDQMERGIRGLYTNYLNEKTDKIINKVFSNRERYHVDQIILNQLYPNKIELLPKDYVNDYIYRILSISLRTKTISYSKVSNLLKTKYRDPILEMLKHYEFSIYDVYPKDPIVKHLDELGIIYSFGNYANTDEKYEPLRYGAIHESDFNYIKENEIGYLETSLLVGGQYDCFPYVELFELYDKEAIKRDYLTIIHNLLFSKISSLGSIGYWYLIAGNIPDFLSRFEIDVKWEDLYDIFEFFLQISLIKI